MIDRTIVGRRIRRAREHAQMSQAALGDAIKIPYSSVSDLELGKRGIDVVELFAIAHALQTKVRALIPEGYEPDTEGDEILSYYWRLPGLTRQTMQAMLKAAAGAVDQSEDVA